MDSLRNIIAGLSKKQQGLAKNLCQKLNDAGYECYMVGGAIRDLLRGEKIKDIDFTTNAKPKDICKVFPKVIETGIKHGTVTVLMNGEAFEVTSYRADGKYTDARRPDEIKFTSSLEEDLSRRDFTINALAYDPLTNKLIDKHNGLVDLEKKIIRTINKAEERFYEDGLRPIRACRFASTIGFELEKKTYKALFNLKIQKRVAQVAIERFRDELLKGFSVSKVSSMLKLLEKSTLLFLFEKRSITQDSQNRYTSPEILKKLNDIYPANPILRIAYWRYELEYSIKDKNSASSSALSTWSNGMLFSQRQSKDILFYCLYFDFQKEIQKEFKDKKESTKIEDLAKDSTSNLACTIRYFLSKLKRAYLNDGTKFLEEARPYIANTLAIEILKQIYENSPLVVADLEIGGDELIKLGYKGAEIGLALQRLLSRVLENPSNNKKALLIEYLKSKN